MYRYAYYFVYDCNGSLNRQLSKVVCLAEHVNADMIFCSLNVLPHFIKSTFLRLLDNTTAYPLYYYGAENDLYNGKIIIFMFLKLFPLLNDIVCVYKNKVH